MDVSKVDVIKVDRHVWRGWPAGAGLPRSWSMVSGLFHWLVNALFLLNVQFFKRAQDVSYLLFQ